MSTTDIRLLFTEFPGPTSQFVEAETLDGKGIKAGTWEQHGQYAALRLTLADEASSKGFRVKIGDESITLLDGDEELVTWDSAEWTEDPALIQLIALAIKVGYTEGADGVRVRLITG